MSQLRNALREKYGTPQAALKALGLDENLLSTSIGHLHVVARTDDPYAHAADVRKALRLASDSAIPKEKPPMPKTRLTRAGAFILGGVAAAVAPKLAKDSALDLTPILAKLKAGQSLKDVRPAIMEGLKGVKLAKDASIEDVTQLLDSLEKVEGMDELEPNSAPMMAEREEDPDAMDAEETSKFLREKGLTEDEVKRVMDSRGRAHDAEETEEEKKKREEEEAKKKAADEAEAKTKEEEGKKAMDAKLEQVKKDTLKLANDIALAKEFVEPWVGKLPGLAFDNAEDVYKKALEMRKVPIDGMHPSAFKPVLAAQPKPGSENQRTTRLAKDAAPTAGFAERFPDAARIRAAR